MSIENRTKSGFFPRFFSGTKRIPPTPQAHETKQDLHPRATSVLRRNNEAISSAPEMPRNDARKIRPEDNHHAGSLAFGLGRHIPPAMQLLRSPSPCFDSVGAAAIGESDRKPDRSTRNRNTVPPQKNAFGQHEDLLQRRQDILADGVCRMNLNRNGKPVRVELGSSPPLTKGSGAVQRQCPFFLTV